jgi:large subunit ribosomal protein L1
MKVQEALAELRKEKGAKFDQTVELIINLKGIDSKKDQVNFIINLPHKIKDKRVCGFLTEKSKIVDSISEIQFSKYSEKKELKKLVKNYDYFIAAAKLMPKVATNFGKVLGPAGKMPSPQLGILPIENEQTIKATLEKINSSLKIRLKEASLKIAVGKQSMSDEHIVQNINAVYHAAISALPKKKENFKNAMIKFTMTKPYRVEIE